MKNTKIFALVATVALLALGTAFTSFAAAKYNWYQVDGIWHCADKNGDDICDDKAKSGNDWYYLNEDGEMVVDALVEIDDDKYYFDETGKMVANDWKKIENTEDDDGDEYYWYYFTASGKAKKNTKSPVSISGKKYMFDEDSRMLYGWINTLASEYADDYTWKDATYYAGDADDGAIKTGWQKIDVEDDDESLDFTEQSYWFYFGTNGKKFTAPKGAVLVEKSINGKQYAFDELGVMRAEWEQTANTPSEASKSISSYAWFRSVDEGAKLKKDWFRVIPVDLINPDDNADEVAHWYYAKGDGTVYTQADGIKTIKGKKYAFNEKGEMIAGLYVDCGADAEKRWLAIDSTEKVDELTKVGAVAKDVYFFGDEETDGSMKTGTVKTEIDGEEYTFYFKSTGAYKGMALNEGGNSVYVNGAKITADADLKYEMFDATYVDGKVDSLTKKHARETFKQPKGTPTNICLISSTGSVIKSGTKKDADGYKYYVYNYEVYEVAAE